MCRARSTPWLRRSGFPWHHRSPRGSGGGFTTTVPYVILFKWTTSLQARARNAAPQAAWDAEMLGPMAREDGKGRSAWKGQLPQADVNLLTSPDPPLDYVLPAQSEGFCISVCGPRDRRSGRDQPHLLPRVRAIEPPPEIHLSVSFTTF